MEKTTLDEREHGSTEVLAQLSILQLHPVIFKAIKVLGGEAVNGL